jgi:hypothetical protein
MPGGASPAAANPAPGRRADGGVADPIGRAALRALPARRYRIAERSAAASK